MSSHFLSYDMKCTPKRILLLPHCEPMVITALAGIVESATVRDLRTQAKW